MAKMAYFDGNSFLSSASDIFAGIGTGNYEIRFKIKSFNSLRSAIFGVDGEYGGLVFVDDQGGNPGTGLIATGLIDGSYPYIRDVVIPDNTIHTIKIKGVDEGLKNELLFNRKIGMQRALRITASSLRTEAGHI